MNTKPQVASVLDGISDSIKQILITSDILKNHDISSINWESFMEYSREQTMGDISIVCFELARLVKINPNQLSIDIAHFLESIRENYLPAISSVSSQGGYVNISIYPQVYSRILSTYREDFHTSVRQLHSEEKIVVEFGSPNTNKPLHIGHIRNFVIGESIARIYHSFGYPVIRTEVSNDRGIAMAKVMVIYDLFYKDHIPLEKPDHFVGKLYTEFEQKSYQDETLIMKAQEVLQKWETGDEYWYSLWVKIRGWARDGQLSSYDTLQISFDETISESDIYKEGKKIVMEGFEKGIFKQDPIEGFIFADLEEYHLPNKILLRSQGTALYITQDLALIKQRQAPESQCFGFTQMIYITAFEQNIQFKQLFAIAHQLGMVTEGLYHSGYGFVRLPEGKMSSRKGTVVLLDDVIQDIRNQIRLTYFSESSLDFETIEHRVSVLTKASYTFFMLGTSIQKGLLFDPKEVIALTGKTGPYIIYAYVRIQSILKKSRVTPQYHDEYSYKEEKNILSFTLKAYEFQRSALEQKDPSIIANFVYLLAEMIHSYYHTGNILQLSKEEQEAKLFVLSKVAEILKDCLYLLGIDTLEEM